MNLNIKYNLTYNQVTFVEPWPDDVSTGSLALVNISASVSLSAADMTTYLKKMSRGEAVEGNPRKNKICSSITFVNSASWVTHRFLAATDVLEVLTEVDEKSRRSPEIIQYFTVSHKQKTDRKQSVEPGMGQHVDHHVVLLYVERPAETHGFFWGAVSKHGFQSGPALHSEQPLVS